MIENSKIYGFLSKIGRFLLKIIDGSLLAGIFLSPNENVAETRGSIFFKIYRLLRGIGWKIFRALRLNKLLEGSIFKMVFLWASLTVILAPIAPTMIIILLSLAGFGSLVLYLLCTPRAELKYYPLNKYVYVFAAVYFISIFTSVDVKGSLYGGCLTVLFIMFYMVMTNCIKKKIQFKALVFVISAVGILVSLYGFYQYMNQSKFGGVWVDTDMFQSISFRVYSTLGNPNVLGEYFLLVIPTAVAGFFVSRNNISRLFYVAAVGAMMICLVITYSRGCYIGIMVAAAVFLVLLDRRFILLGIVGLLIMPFVLPETIINRFMSIGNMNDSSTSYRFYIYMGTINMLKDYWLCGIGPGQSAYNKVYPYYGYNGISAPHSHNTFLQVMCDTGIAGIIVFIAVIYQFFKLLFRAYIDTDDKETKIYTIAFMASISGFLVQSLFDYTFYNYRVMIFFWIYIALGAVATKYASLKGE